MSDAPRIILLLQATRGFDRGLLSGIARYAALAGPWTFYRQPHGYLAPRPRIDLRELAAWKPDGAICPLAQVDQLAELDVPLIAYDVDAYDGPVPAIVSDDAAAGRLAAEHLLAQGHRHFAFCGYADLQWSERRCEAFRQRVEQAGGELAVYHRPSRRRQSWADEEPYVRRWLEGLPKPTALFCANDDRAESVLEIARLLGHGVPEDVSVLGVDDDEYICELQNPTLSSVAMAAERAGYDAAALLEGMIEGRDEMSGQRIVAQASGVVARRSTSLLMVRDPDVRKALRFIRENIARPIQVADVVRAGTLSHRTLNERFHAELGGPINKHLTGARIAYVSRLLVETKMPIHRIARMGGYEDDRHFARYFKRTTGMTPRAYRRCHAPP